MVLDERVAAVDGDHLAGHVRGGFRQQVAGRRDDVGDVAQPARRHARLQALLAFLVAVRMVDQAGRPVVGAVLLVGAESGRAWWSPGRWLSVRPVQALGDTSYAIYLWHFPLIVLGTAVLGGVLPLWATVVVIVVYPSR